MPGHHIVSLPFCGVVVTGLTLTTYCSKAIGKSRFVFMCVVFVSFFILLSLMFMFFLCVPMFGSCSFVQTCLGSIFMIISHNVLFHVVVSSRVLPGRSIFPHVFLIFFAVFKAYSYGNVSHCAWQFFFFDAYQPLPS